MEDNKKNDGLQEEREELQGGSNSDHQNASATRGGTTDMDHHGRTGAAQTTPLPSHGSGLSSKQQVAGSDFDGQVTGQ